MPEEPRDPPSPSSPPPLRQPIPVEPVEPPEVGDAAPAPPTPTPPPYAQPAPYPAAAPYAQPYGYAPPPPPQPYPPSNYPPQSWSAPPAYTQPGAGRPGTVTAIGVMAIIVAALSIIGSFFSGCTSLYSIAAAEQSRMIAGARTTIATTGPGGGGMTADGSVDEGQVDSPAPMNPAERDAIVRALHSKRRLTPPRRRQLEAFLDEYGKQVLFDPAGQPLTTARVLNHIGDVGGEFAGPNRPTTDFFDIKEGSINKNPGRLLVYDDRILFRPADGSDPLRSTADKPPAPGGAVAGQTARTNQQPATPQPFTPAGIPGQGLSSREALAVANTVNAKASNMLNPQQFQTLKNQLESSTYEAFVQPSTTIPGLTSQVRSAVVRDDGSVHVTFAMGTMTLDPAGKLTDATTTFTGRTPAAANNPWGAVPNWGTLNVNRAAATLVAAEAALSVLLAILLLVTGILVLRQTPAARKLLLAYGPLKLLTGALAIAALAWFVRGISATDDGSGTSVAMNMARSFRAVGTASIVIAAVGLIFPIAILIVLVGSREVKDYFKYPAAQ